jgi:hypothetical protein
MPGRTKDQDCYWLNGKVEDTSYHFTIGERLENKLTFHLTIHKNIKYHYEYDIKSGRTEYEVKKSQQGEDANVTTLAEGFASQLEALGAFGGGAGGAAAHATAAAGGAVPHSSHAAAAVHAAAAHATAAGAGGVHAPHGSHIAAAAASTSSSSSS